MYAREYIKAEIPNQYPKQVANAVPIIVPCCYEKI